MAGEIVAQSPDEPRRAHSTHDFTSTSEEGRREVWADVKSPGGGRTYVVGTVDLKDNSGSPTFSYEAIDRPPLPALPISGTIERQVAVLQVLRDDQSIAWQRYFYGNSFFGGGNVTLGTNARAVSVWVGFDEEGDFHAPSTRIAVCGETFDEELPESQAGAVATWSSSRANGFIAVYDGDGNLLWTYHFHGTSFTADSAITDLSIRVEKRDSVLFDVVTYCGISSHGVPTATTPLSPLHPFVPTTACSAGVGGASHNGSPGSQWDGIVGRVSRSQASTSGAVAEFHSIVGGTGQDGLFGIAEIDEYRYGVVGTTADTSATTSSFPFSSLCLDGVEDYCVGVAMIFDASAVPASGGSGSLVLVKSKHLGTVSEGVHTVARDIAVVADALSGAPLLHIVGSTDDPDFQNTTAQNGFQASHGGGVDGFYAIAVDVGYDFHFTHATWFGGAGDQFLSGVAAWAEFPDHVAIVGYDLAVGNGDIVVGSVFRDTTQTSIPLVLLRTSHTGGALLDSPARMGQSLATTNGLPFEEFNQGSTAGGGAAMGPTGRVHVVGATASGNYPVTGSPFVGRNYFGDDDAVRTVFDMLPVGVSRTDGTGSIANNIIVPLPTAGDGGTTPVACRNPYGIRPGSALPDAKRVLLDYEGPPPGPGESPAILVDRPHYDSASLIGAAIDVDFPLTTPVNVSGMELWLNPSTATTYLLPFPGADQSLRWQLGTLPSGSFRFSLQFVVFLNNPLPCGGANLQSIASPALTIDY